MNGEDTAHGQSFFCQKCHLKSIKIDFIIGIDKSHLDIIPYPFIPIYSNIPLYQYNPISLYTNIIPISL